MLDDKDIDRLREIFVTHTTFQKIIDSLEEKITNDNIRLTVIETELQQIKWLVCTVLGASIAILLNLFIK